MKLPRLVTRVVKFRQHTTSILRHSTTMTKDLTEVEGRFVVTPGIEDKIAELGGELSREVTFTDWYYDTKDWKLTLRDYWLRKRDTKWELKYPPISGRSEQNSACKQYAENEDDKEICERVKNILDVTDGECTVDGMLKKGQCELFAEYKTHRRSYKFTSHPNVTVDLDMAGFGYNLGEIEVLTSGSITEAWEMVNYFADKLGVELNGDIPSKMDIYLTKFHPEHNKVLKQLGISKINSKYSPEFIANMDFKA